jgi:peptide/nickel transport system substrate-binding protein
VGVVLLALGCWLGAGCATPAANAPSAAQAVPVARAARTLVLISGGELPSFAPKPLTPTASSARAGIGAAMLNARLVYMDVRGVPQPFLAEALPDLHTDSWRLFPDGTMETVYRLKSGLTWHDGQPLTAGDFVFAWRVYATPEFGLAEQRGFRSIDSVAAPDARSVVIRWKERYFEAGRIYDELTPLPRHLLEQAYQDSPGTSFIGLPYWTSEYVGLGPWKLERREPGAFFEASAFDGFVFGRPRIDQVRVVYQIDPNIVVATMLSGEGHLTDSALLHGEDGVTLEQAWAENRAGVVQWTTDIGKAQEFQSRPEFAVPTQLATDARVRQAIAFAIDRVTLTEICTAGKGLIREIFSHPSEDYYDTVRRAVTSSYSYDPRRAEQLLVQAGFSRGADGGWRTPGGERFTFEQYGLGGTTDDKDSAIIVENLRRFGIDATSRVFATARSSQEERSKISGMLNGSVVLPDIYHSRNAARPENRWTGSNRYGFINSEIDGYIDSYLNTVDGDERVQSLAQIERVAMDQLPALPTYYHAVVIAHTASLKGVTPNLLRTGGVERMMWTWEWGA